MSPFNDDFPGGRPGVSCDLCMITVFATVDEDARTRAQRLGWLHAVSADGRHTDLCPAHRPAHMEKP
jgi:hypothetical protein